MLKDQYREASIGLTYHKLEAFSSDLERINNQEAEQQTFLEQIGTKIQANEQQLHSLRNDILAKEKNLATQQKSTNEYSNKIRSYEADKKIKNEKLRHLQDNETRLNTELTSDKAQIEHINSTLKRLNEDLFEAQSSLDIYSEGTQKHGSELEELRAQQQTAKLKLDQYQKTTTDLQNNIYKLEKDIAVLNIQKDALQQESARTLSDNSAKEGELGQFTTAVDALKDQVAQQQQQYDRTVQVEQELQSKIENKEQTLSDVRSQINRESRLADAKQNEYNLTKSLVDNLEGFPESIKFLRKNAGWKKSYPLFSDILFCKEEYRIAIENYLEPIMNHYVVESKQEAIQSIQLLSDAAKGRANFFVLEAVENATKLRETPPRKDLTSALDIVTVDKKYKNLCEQLLSNVFMLNSESSDAIHNEFPTENIVILHPEGKFSKTRLGVSGGSLGLFEGKRIGRAKNLDNLTKEIKTLNKLVESLQSQENNIVEEISSLRLSSQKDLLDESRTVLNRLNNEYISVKTKQEQYLAFLKNSENRKTDIESNLTVINYDLQKSEPELSALKEENQSIQTQLRELQESYLDISERYNEFSAIFNQENIRFHQQQNKLSGLQKDLEYRESQREALETRITRNSTEYDQIKAAMLVAVPTEGLDDSELVEMYAQKEMLEKALQEFEEDFYASRKLINELEEETTQLRRNKDQHDYLQTELKDKKTTLQLELNSLKERLSVEFDIDINNLLQEKAPEIIESKEALTLKCNKLKKQLDGYGSINPMAKEAYDEIQERHDFITKEKNDLLEAKASLMTTINEIDQSANDKFMNAFNTVRENFVHVFRSLFNVEDSCDMVLSDPANPLESDIDIIAQPKGKRPLSINQLSGGEKTLTATALLFSLYLLKPAPFCIFDEVDAPLDDTNIDKFNNIIKDFSKNSQFIIVSHNKRTIASTQIIYGVTMVEQGISRVVPVDLRDVA